VPSQTQRRQLRSNVENQKRPAHFFCHQNKEVDMPKKYDFYIAGPLFTQAEKDFNLDLFYRLRSEGFICFLPQLTEAGTPRKIYIKNLTAINESKKMIAICDGADMDSGTAWECGRFSTMGNVYALRTDFRKSADDPETGVNLMIGQSASRVFTDRDTLIKWIVANFRRDYSMQL
jgi:nucleoside 2-deoxyribosyltransferase